MLRMIVNVVGKLLKLLVTLLLAAAGFIAVHDYLEGRD